MAKRVRKTEQEYIRARNAAMRSIQRTNKAFGSNIKLSDIVDVPTPAQAKKMSAAELRAATRRLNRARKTDKNEKATFVPTGTGGVTKVSTKDYNAAMSALGKANAALRKRIDVVSRAKPAPKGRGARPAGAQTVQGSYGASKVIPINEIDPFTAFIGGKATGNVDEIMRRFQARGRVFAQRPRAWKESDSLMRRNFEKMFRVTGHDEILAKLKRLTDEQFLWAVYNENLAEFVNLVGMRYEAVRRGGPDGGDITYRVIEQADNRALMEVGNILDDAAAVRFE